MSDEERSNDEASRIALSAFRAKEDQIEKKKMEVREKEYKEALEAFNVKSREKAQLLRMTIESNAHVLVAAMSISK
ncbi:hypothetical protein Cni_G09887 [Canna indica]|uniref:RAB6-interacting golgin n=1 Tax=Canna indica TaxID=4628 RepID=A0AAQ3K3B7_9LILI|nr:hypothetical protein Cni_G09887 [Canna indica]